MYGDGNIDEFHQFEYMPRYNQLKLEILDGGNPDLPSVCDLIMDLRELNANRFVKKHY